MNKLLQKLTGALLVLLLLIPLACTTVLAAPDTASYGFDGLTMSVLGDSISTFGGVSNNTDYNSTLANNKIYYNGSNYGISRADTWWQQTIDRLGMELMVNNAWSGSSVLTASGENNGIPAEPAYKNRCINLHNDNVADLKDPDIIAVFLGTNDVNINVVYGHAMGSATPDYDSLIFEQPDGSYTYADPASFADAYAIMLHKISVRYPDAEVYCLSLLQRNKADSDQDRWQPHLIPYNTVISSIAQHFGACYVDQYNDTGITSNGINAAYYMANTLHPNKAGMDAMTNCFVSALLNNSKYSTVRDSLYEVSYDFGHEYVFPAEGTVKTAVAGQPFSLRLDSYSDNARISVTMDGVDITDQCYSNGLISIPAVTGDIAISAQAPASCDGNHEGWTPITAGGTYENTSGTVQKYYLANDITGDLSLTGGEFILCMCGHSIQASNIVIKAHFGSTVTLINCAKSGGTITNTGSSHGIEVYQNSSLTMRNGVSVANCTKGNHAVFVYDNSTFNMEGGSIVGNTGATAGAVNLGKNSTFHMSGGLIGNNTSAANAGAVNVTNSCTFTMNGGTISGNTAKKYGGAVYMEDGTLNISENAKLIGNSASTNSNGSAIYAAKGSVHITGGYIENPDTNTLYGLSGSVYDISGGTIKGNLVPGGSSARFTVRDNAIIEGMVNSYGIVNIQGGTINGNVTAVAGSLFGKVYISGGAVTGTLAIGNSEECVFQISGGKFAKAPSSDLLATNKGMLSVMKNPGSDAADFPYVVAPGFICAGEYIGHESAMVLGLYLNADVNFLPDSFNKEDYTVTVSGGNDNVTTDFKISNGNLLITAHGIAAKEMHDVLTFTVKKGNEIFFTDSLSVYEAAKVWASDANTKDDTMLADMIAYGNEARKEFKYNYTQGDVLPELDGATTGTKEWTATEGAGVSNGQQDTVAVTLTLKDKIELNVYINDTAAQISNVTFDGVPYDETNYRVYSTGSKHTCFTFFNIPVMHAKKAVAFTVTLSDGTQFDVKYSIADYVIQMQNEDQAALIQALMRYVDSVSKYFEFVSIWPDLREDELGFIALPVFPQ